MHNQQTIWNSDEIEVKGILKINGENFKEIDMTLTKDNMFEGNVDITSTGNYELILYAYYSKSGNIGIDIINYVIYE